MNQAANDTRKLMLKRYAVIIDTAIVMRVSFSANPNIRAACIPFPGSPKAFACGHIYSLKVRL
jgi:hypothetical protein